MAIMPHWKENGRKIFRFEVKKKKCGKEMKRKKVGKRKREIFLLLKTKKKKKKY